MPTPSHDPLPNDPVAALEFLWQEVRDGRRTVDDSCRLAAHAPLVQAGSGEVSRRLVLMFECRRLDLDGPARLAGGRILQAHAAALCDAGKAAEALPLFEAVERFLEGEGETAAAASCRLRRAEALRLVGHVDEAVAIFDSLFSLLQHDPRERGRCHIQRANARY